MIKFFALIFLGLAMFSCASDQVIESPSPINNITNTPISTQNETKKSEPVVTKAALVAVSKVDISYTDLEKAVSLGDDERIKTVSTDLLQLNSKDLRALNALSMYYYKKQQFAAAELLLNKALMAHPKSAAIYNNLGLVELAKKEKREALNMFHKALELDAKNYSAAANIAAIYVREKSYVFAAFALEKVADSDEMQIDSLNNYAIALSATGKHNEASRIFERILKESPDHKLAVLNYSILLIEKQAKYKEGLDLLNRLKFIGGDNEDRELMKNLENKAKAGLADLAN